MGGRAPVFSDSVFGGSVGLVWVIGISEMSGTGMVASIASDPSLVT